MKSAETHAHAVLRRVRRQGQPRLKLRLHPEIAAAVHAVIAELAARGEPLDCQLDISEDGAMSRDAMELLA